MTVSRNKGGLTCDLCPLCKRAPETLGHVFIGCKELDKAQSKMHDEIATTLIDQMSLHIKSGRVHHHTPLGTLWPGEEIIEAGISDFVPDGIMIDTANRRIIIVEFARGLSEQAADMDEKAQAKKNAYHSTLLWLRRHPEYKGWAVLLHTFIMGITTTYQQPLWDSMFKAAGLTFAQGRKVQKECVKTCVLALHHLLSASDPDWRRFA